MIKEICYSFLKELNGRKHHLLHREGVIFPDGNSGEHYLSLTSLDSVIVAHERITSDTGREMVKHWVFTQSDGQWIVSHAEGDGKIILENKIEEAIAGLSKRFSGLVDEIPVASPPTNKISNLNDIRRKFLCEWPALILSGSYVMLFLLFLQFISSFQYRVVKLEVASLREDMIRISRERSEEAGDMTRLITQERGILESMLMSLNDQMKEVDILKMNTSFEIKRRAEELPINQNHRKIAYNLIAERVEMAAGYAEIVSLLDDLPETNEEAGVFLYLDSPKKMALSQFRPVIDGITFPVRGKEIVNDGSGFLVSSTFADPRPMNFRSGGTVPHYAVDITNSGNVLDITPDARVIRDITSPGVIVAVDKGTIKEVNFDKVFGWFVEIRHELNPKLKEKYPDALYWTSFYAHMDSPFNWEGGESIEKNQKIGDIGNTGLTTGPHLHFEARIYSPNAPFLNDHGRFIRIDPYVRGDGESVTNSSAFPTNLAFRNLDNGNN